jgi:predicted amidohydrolase
MQDLRLAMVQMTSQVGDSAGNIRRMEGFLARAAEAEVDIICFPELSISGYNAGDRSRPTPESIPGPSTAALSEVTGRYGLTVCAGLLERGRNGVVYNTQIVFAEGGVKGVYRKTHCPTAENGTFSQGTALPVFDHPKIRFGIEICYDSHFPEVSTRLAERGADLILMPHASAGSETADDKRARWLRYMPARAYDNTVFAAVCNQVGDNGASRIFAGVTFVCDPLGRVMAQSTHSTEEQMVLCDLEAAALAEARKDPETFYRHFRRQGLYDQWSKEDSASSP